MARKQLLELRVLQEGSGTEYVIGFTSRLTNADYVADCVQALYSGYTVDGTFAQYVVSSTVRPESFRMTECRAMNRFHSFIALPKSRMPSIVLALRPSSVLYVRFSVDHSVHKVF